MNNTMKWIANIMMVFAMVSLLSPKVAAESVTPWVAFFVVNAIYLYDSIAHKNWPWFWLCAFCSVWHTLLIASRTVSENVFSILAPIVNILEKLP